MAETVNFDYNPVTNELDMVGGGGPAPVLEHMTNVTYEELVALRNNAGLKPGQYYRITDYACTTTQPYTRSADHAFDIIVRADAVNKLNENAFAAHNSLDTYFWQCKLEAWELKYCIDNDTVRFQWADDTNGKGVVYYMKDEFGNECPYDFKNILFQRWGIDDFRGETRPVPRAALVVDGEQNIYGYYYGAKSLSDSQVPSTAIFGSKSGYFYTFALKELATGDWHDYTVAVYTIIKNDENIQMCCFDNHISPAVDEYNGKNGNMTQVLNNIVMFNCCEDLREGDEKPQNDYSYCNSNHFAQNCYNNSVGNNFQNNSVGNDCHNNSVGNNFRINTVGNNFQNNSVGNGCYNNSVGNNFQNNSVGNDFYNNSVGNGCYNNSVGNNFQNNSVGNSFGNNSVGNSFGNNSVGNDCYGNSVGNDCYGNSVGNGCYNNSVGNYVRQLTVFEGVMYCNITGGASDQSYVQNAQILNGTSGVNSSNLLTVTFIQDMLVTQVAGLYGMIDGVNRILKVWSPANLVP